MAIALRSGEAIHDVEGLVERPDGSRIWATVHIDPVKDDAGHVLGAINCFTDTTELHQARVDSAEREAHTRQLLDAMPAAVYTTDETGRVTYYNQAAVDLAGRRPEIGSDEWCVTWKLYWPDGTPLPRDQCPMALALSEKRPNCGMEAVAERPNGSRVRDGPTVTKPTRRGFGRTLIEKAVAQEFGAAPAISFEPEGLAYAIEVPLSAVRA